MKSHYTKLKTVFKIKKIGIHFQSSSDNVVRLSILNAKNRM